MLTNDVSQSSDTDSSEEFELIYRRFSTISKGNRIHTKVSAFLAPPLFLGQVDRNFLPDLRQQNPKNLMQSSFPPSVLGNSRSSAHFVGLPAGKEAFLFAKVTLKGLKVTCFSY